MSGGAEWYYKLGRGSNVVVVEFVFLLAAAKEEDSTLVSLFGWC